MSHSFPNFVALLRQHAQNLSDKTVFTFLQDGETVTGVLSYADLDQRARAIATTLRNAGAEGERALLLYPPGLDFVAAFFGCLYAGTVAVPAYPPRANRSMERLQAIINDAEARFALTTGELKTKLAGKLIQADATEIHCLATDDEVLGGVDGIAGLADAWQPTNPAGHELAFLQYTSGSTGSPKGVMVSHGNLIHNSALINQGFQDDIHSKVISWLPPYHDMGLIGGVLQPLYLGASMVFMPPVSFLQRPLRWLQVISDYGGSTSGGPNFAYELCAKQITAEQKANLDLSRWKIAFTGAEPVRAHTLELFAEAFAECGFQRNAFYPCYGMAEATLMVTGGNREVEPILTTVDGQALEQRQTYAPKQADQGLDLVASGRSLAGQSMLIVDPENCAALPDGEVGEIWVSGPSIAQGYWKREELTRSCFQAKVAEVPVPALPNHRNGDHQDNGLQEQEFLRTGDLGFLKNEELFVTGRLKDLIIIRGRNHYPQDIEETVVQSHPDLQVAASAAFSVDIDGDEQLVVVQEVHRRALRKLQGDQVTQAIRQAIIQHHGLQPHAVLLLRTNSIPKTSSGKIQRYACRNGFLKDSLRVVAKWQAGDAPSDQANAAVGEKAVVPAESTNSANSNGRIPTNFSPVANPRRREIATWLANRLGELMAVSPQGLSYQEPMASFGLDSLKVVRLSAELEDLLGLKLSPTLVYDYPTIDSLSSYLAHQLEPETAQHAQATAQAQAASPRKSAVHEAIAVVGLGCRFPGANSPQDFWDLLIQGKDAIQPTHRWPTGKPEWGGFLEQVDQFEPRFFGLSPREAQRMDPQQRLLLEVAWETLEQAGVPAPQLAGSNTGVFVGLSSSDYSQLQSNQGIPVDAYSGTGNAHSVAANRLSYFLDLQGPSLAVDTACSSSLVAVHLASQSLNNGDCDLAIAGGVNLTLSPDLTQVFSQAGMMAEDGRCKTFDAKADGYVRGEGCGLLLLKRLSLAERDGDRILAVIQGSAINQDGRSNGLTAPNGRAQQAVIRQALAQADAKATDIGYIEAHGTGTSLGDPIELNALQAVFSEGLTAEAGEAEASKQQWIGSVKTNIGHLEAAAGVAGLIKSILSLQQEVIPPHLHLQELNPHINLNETLKIPTEAQSWPRGIRPRLAGVSSFGFGGTNAHVILGEAPVAAPLSKDASIAQATNQSKTIEPDKVHQLLTLSAKTAPALMALAQRYSDWLTHHTDAKLSDLCFSANTGRTAFEHRLAVLSQSPEQLQAQLQAFIQGEPSELHQAQAQPNPTVAFLFTGQGSQSPGMGQQLYQTEPVFKAALDRCAEILAPRLELNLIELLYGSASSELNQTIYTQPALFAIEYALAQLWQSWGVRPSVVLGHSVGEYVAACLAGVFSLEDGLRLITARAKLMQSLPTGGGMMVVFAKLERFEALLKAMDGEVAIAAYNAPELIVLSGPEAGLKTLSTQLKDESIRCRALQVSHAFHSQLMEPILAEFETVASQVTYHAPQLPLISNLTGQLATDEIATPGYWVRHIRQPVLFEASMACLQARSTEQGDRIFLEIGPRPTLLSMGRQCFQAQKTSETAVDPVWLASLYPGKEDLPQLLNSLAALTVQGVPVNWSSFYSTTAHQRLDLPTYPFQRQRCWLEGLAQPSAVSSAKVQTAGSIASGATTQDSAGDTVNQYQVVWQELGAIAAQPNPPVQSWLVLEDSSGVGHGITTQLQAQSHNVYRVVVGDRYQQLEPNLWQIPTDQPDLLGDILTAVLATIEQSSSKLQGVINSWGIDAPTTTSLTNASLMAAQSQSCAPVLAMLRALTLQTPAKLWLITQGVQRVNSATQPNVAQSPLLGLGKVIALEHPECWGGCIDLSPAPKASELEQLVYTVQQPENDDQVALRGQQRYGARLQEITALDSSTVPSVAIQPQSSYLITGGLGALGLKLAQWLADQGARQLVLISRRSPSPQQQASLDALTHQGVTCCVHSLDVADSAAVTALCAELRDGPHPLRGVIHAAGSLADGLLQGQTWEQWQQVLAPKLQGSWNLHQGTQADKLDFFWLFSSVASILGSPGQGNYAAANAFLDSLAQLRHAQGKPALSLNWGPWVGEGMANQTRLNKGLMPLAAGDYLAQLPQLLTAPMAQVGLFQADWSFLLAQFPQLRDLGYFKAVASNVKEAPPAASIQAQLRAASAGQRLEILQQYLGGVLAKILQADPATINPTASLLDLGMDSLMVMEAINQLKQDLQLMIYPREFYERPRLDALTAYLTAEFEQSHGLASTTHPATGTGQAGVSPLARSPLQASPTSEATTTQRLVKQKAGPMAFILSSPRSGSTLLRVMLAGNPALFSPPELHLLPFETLGDRKQQLGVSRLGEGLQRALMDLKGLDTEASQALIEEFEAQDLPLEAVYRELETLAGDRLLIDKSPSYASDAANLARAERCIEGAKYIHLVRHPYAVLESFCRMRMDKLVGDGQQSPLDLAEQIWQASNENTLQLSQQIPADRYHLVSYEALVREPEQVLRGICDFLGVPFAEAMLAPYQGDRMTDGVHKQSMSLGDPNFTSRSTIDASLAEAWREIKLPRLLGSPSQQLAQQLAYELPREAAQAESISHQPSETQLEAFAATMTEKFLSVGGSTICLCTWGPADGPLVLCLHGILEQGASWIEVAARLAAQGYRIVAPDLRGHGHSTHVEQGNSYNLMDFLADLDGIVEQITDKPFTLVGHSLGSVVGALFASVRPNRILKLIMVETILPTDVSDDEAAQQLAAHLDYLSTPPKHPVFADVETAAERLRLATPALSKSLAMLLAKRITEPCEGGIRWRWAPLLRTRAGIGFNGINQSRYLGLLRRIRNPITLIYGDRSQFNRQDDLQAQQQALTNAKRIVVEGGHNLPFDAPSAIADAILSS